MYLAIAQAAFEVEDEIYKKHFAKAIGNEMCEEKVVAVKMMIAKLAHAVPYGYSKSTDKITDHIKAQEISEVNQFFDENNKDLDSRRFLDPAKITTKMKAEEEDEEEERQTQAAKTQENADLEESKDPAAAEESKDATSPEETPGEVEERKAIEAVEKTVQIRLCNYSIMVRAAQFNSGLSAQLMALLGGYGSLLFGGGEGGKKLIDREEEQILEEK